MTKDLLAVFEYFEKEKGIDRATMIDALQTALLTAARKSIGPAREMRVDIEPNKGIIKAFAKLLVVEESTKPFEEIAYKKARLFRKGIQIGDELEVEVTPKDFGRIAAQTAKQAIMQRLRQAEKARIFEEFRDRAGEIVSGTVRRFDKSDVVFDLGRFEAVMPKEHRVSTEEYNVGDRLRAYVVAVENESRGPEIILSRSHPNFVRRLFESEVSEIGDRTVEIKSIARDPGYRTKIAVASADDRIDPVGACVGLRGARVKNIVRELNNEKVDIIKYFDDPVEFLRDALRPIAIRSCRVDAAEHRLFVTVSDEDLSKAIGRRGMNAKLTSKLIGWDVQIDKDESAHEAFESRIAEAGRELVDILGLTEEQAEQLTRNGMVNLEVIAQVEPDDITGTLGITTEEAETILEKARAARP